MLFSLAGVAAVLVWSQPALALAFLPLGLAYAWLQVRLHPFTLCSGACADDDVVVQPHGPGPSFWLACAGVARSLFKVNPFLAALPGDPRSSAHARQHVGSVPSDRAGADA